MNAKFIKVYAKLEGEVILPAKLVEQLPFELNPKIDLQEQIAIWDRSLGPDTWNTFHEGATALKELQEEIVYRLHVQGNGEFTVEEVGRK